MIYTHVYFLDALLSLRYLYDNLIFGPDTIKHYETNIGNRSFQLNYNTQWELPTVIINYQDSRVVEYHPWQILQSSLGNHSKFPILFNKTKDLVLELQEEEYELTISVILNCESQLGALSMQHQILNYLPIGKPLQLYHYYSFLEIPEKFLNPEMFDINNDTILNLYTKKDTLKDKPVHCCAVQYEPILRLDSCTLGIANSEQHSFSVESVFVMNIPMPITIQIPFEERPIKQEKTTLVEKDVVISLNKNYPTFRCASDKGILSLPCLIKNTDISSNLVVDDQLISVSGNLKQSISKNNMSFVFNHDDIKSVSTTTYDYLLKSSKTTISGPVYGDLNILGQDDIRFTAIFDGTYNRQKYSIPIRGEYSLDTRCWDTDNIKVLDNIHVNALQPLLFGNKLSDFTKLSARLLKFIPEKSKITSIQVMENESSLIHHIPVDITLNKYGNFIAPVTYIDSQIHRKIVFQLQGKINPKNLEIQIEPIDEQIDNSYTILSIIGDFSFLTNPKYGARYIEKINFSINADKLSPISMGTSSIFLKDNFDKLSQDLSRKILYTFILFPQSNEIDSIFQISPEQILLRIEFPIDFNYDQMKDIISWNLFFEENHWNNHSQYFKIFQDNTTPPNILQLEICQTLYSSFLYRCDISNPIFFQVFEGV